MRDYSITESKTCRTLGNNPKTCRQLSISEILKNRTSSKCIQQIHERDQNVLQMMPKINEISSSDIPRLTIEYVMTNFSITLEQAKQLLGKYKLLSDTKSYVSIAAFVAAHLSKEKVESYFKATKSSDEAKRIGDETEAITASIIGGKVNRGKGNKDVEWRMITRKDAEKYKKDIGIKEGKETDQELFENWSILLERAKDASLKTYLKTILSTPIDAFSLEYLALAGGSAKFDLSDPEHPKLLETAKYRIKQLKKISEKLEYKPVVVFNAETTCELCRLVARECRIEVIHLGEKQDSLPD